MSDDASRDPRNDSDRAAPPSEEAQEDRSLGGLGEFRPEPQPSQPAPGDPPRDGEPRDGGPRDGERRNDRDADEDA